MRCGVVRLSWICRLRLPREKQGTLNMNKLLAALFLSTLIILPARSQDRKLSHEKRSDAARSEKRIALVIGNGLYKNAPLVNPTNDAKDVSQALVELGFEVIHKENLTQNQMREAIRAFGERIRNGGVGLFYYAGHGIQVDGRNYLVPVTAIINHVYEVEYESIDVGFVLAQMENARNRLNLVILDACRNNPFARKFRSTTKGLASIDAPSGTMIAYATAPGSVASDGDSKNGLYTQELLVAMQMPGLQIEQVFKQVRIAVQNKTDGKQVPWESSSLIGDFYFLEAGVAKNETSLEVKTTSSRLNEPSIEKPGPTLPLSSSEMIRRAQTALREQGYYEGILDGVMNERVSKVLRIYQWEHNLTESGSLDSDTAHTLGIIPGSSYKDSGIKPILSKAEISKSAQNIRQRTVSLKIECESTIARSGKFDRGNKSDPNIELLLALDSLIEAAKHYEMEVSSPKYSGNLREPTLVMARVARKADRVIATTTSQMVNNLRARWDAIRMDILSLMRSQNIQASELDNR
jgi:hypothetical protein